MGEGFWGRLFDCFYCLSVWVALPFAYLLGETWGQRLLHWPAISAAAILLERLTSRPEAETIPDYVEDEEEPDVVLRRKETTTAGRAPAVSVASQARGNPDTDN